ncbi:MAG: hypothetical protein RIB60_11610 [Phycisphaerales bacterium]
MNRTKTIMAAALLGAAGLAHAAPLSETFTYQAQLEDAGELASGSYDFRFQLFDASAGGSPVGNQIFRTNTAVSDGLVNTTVNFGGVGLIFDGERRWLEVAVRPAGVGAYTVLGPRQELTTTPYAAYALNADTAAFAENALVSLDEAYDVGNTINANAGEVAIENSSGTAELRLGRDGAGAGGGGELSITNNNGDPVIELRHNFSTNSGSVNIYDAIGARTVYLDKDVSTGGGGFFSVYRHDGSGPGSSIGFQVDGNRSNTQDTHVTIRGENTTMFFDTTTAGDGTVVLPVDAINASEISNEPGVAETANSGAITLTASAATIDTLASATINCPSSGYVLVIGTFEASVSHQGAVGGIGGTTSTANFGVSSTAGSLEPNQDIELRLDNDLFTGNYDFPVTVHGVFPVSAGSRTFYLLGDQNSTGHSITALDMQLSCIFVPTAYGNASRVPPPDDGDHTVLPYGWSDAEVMAERGAAIAADEARRDEEFLMMQDKIARLERRLDDMQQGSE